MLKTAVIMGSDSDFETMKACIKKLKAFDMPFEVRVISAHRTPRLAEEFASNAEKNGFGVIIAAAGKAAHLGGVLAAYTTLPVIAVPIKSSTLDGLDSLLSMVQMPSGIPVATVAINGGANAGLLAAKILATSDAELLERLKVYSNELKEQVQTKDARLQEVGYKNY